MNTDNYKKGLANLRSASGQATMADQVSLESNSNSGASRARRQALIESHFKGSDKGILSYSRDKIAGNYEDLNERFNKTIASVGAAKNPNSVEHFNDMQKIRADRAGRDALSEQSFVERYKRTSLGLDADMQASAKSGHGGGIQGMHSYKGGFKDAFRAAGAQQHLSRAGSFIMGHGMGHDALNAIGIMTKHQKDVLASNSVGRMGKIMTAGGTALGGIYAASIAGDYLSGRNDTTLTDNAATGIASAALSIGAGTQAFRVAKELTHAGTSLIPKGVSRNYTGKGAGLLKAGSSVRPYAKWAAGATVGAGAFLATTALVDAGTEILRSAASKDNSINRLKSKVYQGDYTGDISTQTRQLQTSRQRTLEKLSKSGLNDRATILGNEAMVLKGLL